MVLLAKFHATTLATLTEGKSRIEAYLLQEKHILMHTKYIYTYSHIYKNMYIFSTNTLDSLLEILFGQTQGSIPRLNKNIYYTEFMI